MKNKTYDYIKIGVTIVLPALGTAYGVIGNVWGLPFTEQVVTTVTALTAAGAAIVNGISKTYNKEASDNEE